MRIGVLLFPLAVALACTEPKPLVVGQFGGRLMSLTASHDAGQFMLACGQVTTPALRLDQAGTALVSGTGQFLGAGRQPITVDVELQTITSGHLRVTIHFADATTPKAFDLFRDQPADFSGVVCLA